MDSPHRDELADELVEQVLQHLSHTEAALQQVRRSLRGVTPVVDGGPSRLQTARSDDRWLLALQAVESERSELQERMAAALKCRPADVTLSKILARSPAHQRTRLHEAIVRLRHVVQGTRTLSVDLDRLFAESLTLFERLLDPVRGSRETLRYGADGRLCRHPGATLAEIRS
jgi:hypothetical protein